MDLSTEFLITIGSALLAGLSFIAFAYPFLKKSEDKERYKDVIQKRKKNLFDQTRQAVEKRGQDNLSAKDSVATFFKVQELAGNMGEKARDLLLQAGIRNPVAPIFYLCAQMGLPVLFCLLAFLVLKNGDEQAERGMFFLVMMGSIVAGFFLPRLLIKNQADKRQQDLSLTFPDALDMMLICVQGGIGLEQTVERVADEVSEHSPTLAEELGILSAEMAMLNDRAAALRDFGRRVGGFGKSFASALIQAEQYGTSVSQALRVMSTELRDIRMAKAEEKAASLPPKLTVPMILFFLPALFIIILGPAGIQASNAGIGG